MSISYIYETWPDEKSMDINGGWSPSKPNVVYKNPDRIIPKSLYIPCVTDHSSVKWGYVSEEYTQKTDVEQLRMLYYWRIIIEGRKNSLYSLIRHLKSENLKLSVQTALSEQNIVSDNIQSLFDGMPQIYFEKNYEDSDKDNYFTEFVSELLNRTLKHVSVVKNADNINCFVDDMRYMTAIEIDSRNSEYIYRCTDDQYMEHLISKGLRYSKNECKECHASVTFTGFDYCLMCGRSINRWKKV